MRLRRLLTDNRGMAFITVLYVVFTVGLMLFAFLFLSQNEVGFAAYNRNSTMALGLAEAGAQEAIDRLNQFGAIPGPTTTSPSSPCPVLSSASPNTFRNSLATSAAAPGASGTVTYQFTLQGNQAVFPILSCATFGGAQRSVRVFEQTTYKPGLGSVIFGPQVTFQGNAQPITGDTYAQTSILFQQYSKSPQPASGATATNLISPQVLGGTTIGVHAGGPGTYTFECADSSLTEVAPTTCGGSGRSSNLPVNWHPMIPIGMAATDFNAVVQWIAANPSAARNLGLAAPAPPATQNGVTVTYTPVSYTPPYWSLSGYNGTVPLVVATQPFCVNAGGRQVQQASGNPPSCPAGWDYYGNWVGGQSYTTRYLDWGLVSDDLSRAQARTFFQAPTCSTCNNGGPNGNQNGIRYIPLLPPTNVLAHACQQNVDPGINVFDQVNADGISCANPPTQTIDSTSVTISGTKSNPEFLVIDNGPPGNGQVVKIFGTTGPGSCTGNLDQYNWGIILATGDVDLQANLSLVGLVYTPGNITSHGTVVVSGGLFSSNMQSSGTQVNQVDSWGNINFCTASTAQLLLSPLFFDFSAVSWQDRPLDEP
jgi:Tfp pilus assembly protein PilX